MPIANSENNATNHPLEVREFLFAATLIKIVILAIFLSPLINYTIFSKSESDGNIENTTEIAQNQIIITNGPNYSIVEESSKTKFVKKVIVQQPSCSKSYMLVILKEMCNDIVIKNQLCTPGDFFNDRKHHVPRSKSKKTANKEHKVPTIVNYAVGGLLMTSLGAALIELYKAKKAAPSKKHGKNPLSRKCSLADLTVLKHQRKELVRRESLMEVPEESLPSRQLGFRPPPLHRRCSFPVGTNIRPLNSYDPSRRMSIIESKPIAVLESRRQSILVDNRKASIDYRVMPMDGGRRTSVTEGSPDRKHHSRLVHRH